jgi:hypothetical protein
MYKLETFRELRSLKATAINNACERIICKIQKVIESRGPESDKYHLKLWDVMKIIQSISKWYSRFQGCSACGSDGIYGSGISQFRQIKFVKKLKRGKLFTCERCHNLWYFLENEKWLYKIPKGYESVVEIWNNTNNDISENTCRQLKRIGGIAHNSMDRISFPCCIVERNGTVADPAIVIISKSAPYNWPDLNLIKWASEIKEVKVSPLALPIKIRLASKQKREESMGFAPVPVTSRSGLYFTLGCESEWFNANGVLGQDLELSAKLKKWKNIVWPQAPRAYFFADWFDGCELLITNASTIK